MTQTMELIEQVLRESYHQQVDAYTRALALADQLENELPEGRDPLGKLQAIMRVLDEVAEWERRIERDKRLWAESGEKPGPELSVSLDQVGSLVTRLIEQLGRSELIARAQKSRLTPLIENTMRSKQMQRAYQGGGQS